MLSKHLQAQREDVEKDFTCMHLRTKEQDHEVSYFSQAEVEPGQYKHLLISTSSAPLSPHDPINKDGARQWK